MELNKFYGVVKELVEEELELEEATVTGNVDGYNTPFAFGDKSQGSKKKRKKYSTNSTGYKIVKELVKEILNDLGRK